MASRHSLSTRLLSPGIDRASVALLRGIATNRKPAVMGLCDSRSLIAGGTQTHFNTVMPESRHRVHSGRSQGWMHHCQESCRYNQYDARRESKRVRLRHTVKLARHEPATSNSQTDTRSYAQKYR